MIFLLKIAHFSVFSFSPDPTDRVNFWSLTVGVAITFAKVYGADQAGFQRYSSLRTIREAKL